MKKLLATIIDFLFPKEKIISEIESLTPYQFALKAAPSMHPDALFAYRDPIVEKALWELKYRTNRKMSAIFAPLLYERMIGALSERAFFSPAEKPIVTFIPASAIRLSTRHFDQGELILEGLRRQDHAIGQFQIESAILKPLREIVSQHLTANKAERLSNMHHAFGVADGTLIRNRTVLVLDDIMTTGATLAEARRALLEAGAREVHLLSIAH